MPGQCWCTMPFIPLTLINLPIRKIEAKMHNLMQCRLVDRWRSMSCFTIMYSKKCFAYKYQCMLSNYPGWTVKFSDSQESLAIRQIIYLGESLNIWNTHFRSSGSDTLFWPPWAPSPHMCIHADKNNLTHKINKSLKNKTGKLK